MLVPVLFSCSSVICNAKNGVIIVDYDLNEGLVTVGDVAQRTHLFATQPEASYFLLNSVN